MVNERKREIFESEKSTNLFTLLLHIPTYISFYLMRRGTSKGKRKRKIKENKKKDKTIGNESLPSFSGFLDFYVRMFEKLIFMRITSRDFKIILYNTYLFTYVRGVRKCIRKVYKNIFQGSRIIIFFG